MDVEPAAQAESSNSPRKSPAKSPMRTDDAPAPAKRARTDTRSEDKKRGQRMFGNILGTLRKFQDDDKSKRGSEAAKRREETAARIAAKIASETNAQHEITNAERELRTLRIATENATYVLEHKEIALASRHSSLRTASKYLFTTSENGEPLLEGGLYPSAPLPLARGPRKNSGDSAAPPLFFLPKVLVPEQEDALRERQARVDTLIADEVDALRTEREDAARTADTNREKMADLTVKLQRLKEQAGKAPRAPVQQRSERERSREPTQERSVGMGGSGGRDAPPHQREVDVSAITSVRQDDGEMDVEY